MYYRRNNRRFNTRRGLPLWRRRRVIRKRRNIRNNASTQIVKKNIGSQALTGDRLMFKMNYDQFKTITLANGIYQNRFALNDISVCDQTASTGTVQGFSNFSNLFNKFRVHGSKIKSTFSNQGASPTTHIVAPLATNINSSITGAANYAIAINQPYAKNKLVSGDGGIDRSTIIHYMTTKRILGLKDIRQEDACEGTMTAPGSPQYTPQWYVALFSSNLTDNATSALSTKITYYVELFDRKAATSVG